MGTDFEEGFERAMDGKASSRSMIDGAWFHSDKSDDERERGYEAGVVARALADKIAEQQKDSDESNADVTCDSSSSSYSSSATDEPLGFLGLLDYCIAWVKILILAPFFLLIFIGIIMVVLILILSLLQTLSILINKGLGG